MLGRSLPAEAPGIFAGLDGSKAVIVVTLERKKVRLREGAKEEKSF